MLTLVVGDEGGTGRRVSARLAAGGHPARPHARFDWADRRSWRPALRGAGAVYLSAAPSGEAVRSFAALAVRNGVSRIVLCSRRGDAGGLDGEQAVRECGAAWTIVRVGWVDQVFSEGCLLEPVRRRRVTLPARPVGEPFVDVGDVADVVVAALTEDGHAGRIYEATGPRLLTFAEAVEELAEATGRTIRYVPVSAEHYAALLAQHELPEEVVTRLTRVFTELLDGRNARLAGGVERAIGREPRDFADYARDTAPSGVWEQPA
jgi:uncharacterized protein YbjT (DUF2867 family)